jgi:small subunit ribosomal protein S6
MSKLYETTIIVKPDLGNDQVKDLLVSINNFFSDNNVSLGYQEDWGIKNLKFNISKYSKGSYKFFRFEAGPEFPKKFDDFLKYNTECLRYLISNSSQKIDEVTPQISRDN